MKSYISHFLTKSLICNINIEKLWLFLFILWSNSISYINILTENGWNSIRSHAEVKYLIYLHLFRKEMRRHTFLWKGRPGFEYICSLDSVHNVCPSTYLLFNFFKFYWSILDLHCYDNFCYTVKCFSYTYIHSFSVSFPIWIITDY